MVLSLIRTTTENADHIAWLRGFLKIRPTHANSAVKQVSRTKELVSALQFVPQVTTATRESATKTNVQVFLRQYSLMTFQTCAFPNVRMEALAMFPLVNASKYVQSVKAPSLISLAIFVFIHALETRTRTIRPGPALLNVLKFPSCLLQITKRLVFQTVLLASTQTTPPGNVSL